MAVTYYWTSPNLSLRAVRSEDIIIFDMLDDENGDCHEGICFGMTRQEFE